MAEIPKTFDKIQVRGELCALFYLFPGNTLVTEDTLFQVSI